MIQRIWKVRVYYRRFKCRCGKRPCLVVFSGEAIDNNKEGKYVKVVRLYRCRSCALQIADAKNLVEETALALRAAS